MSDRCDRCKAHEDWYFTIDVETGMCASCMSQTIVELRAKESTNADLAKQLAAEKSRADAMERERDEAKGVAATLATMHEKRVAERDAMRPVVEAAVAWRDHWTCVTVHKESDTALLKAVTTYTKESPDAKA